MIGDDDIEDWDDFEEVDLSKKRYVSDETREKMTKSESLVIKQFKQVHGNRYDYSKVKYVRGDIKVIIICKEHGEFLQNPHNHKKGQGCKKCGHKDSGVITQSEIIKSFRKTHGNKYDYSKVKYVRGQIKVIIICKEHGEFLQTPMSHKQGAGCKKCAKVLIIEGLNKGRKTQSKIAKENRLKDV